MAGQEPCYAQACYLALHCVETHMVPVPRVPSLLICSNASDSPADTAEEVQNPEESRRKDLAEGTAAPGKAQRG